MNAPLNLSFRIWITFGASYYKMKHFITEALTARLESKYMQTLSWQTIVINFSLLLIYVCIIRIKENLRKAYAQAANDFQQQLDSISMEQSLLDGNLDVRTVMFCYG
jgi:hypothetical protein